MQPRTSNSKKLLIARYQKFELPPLLPGKNTTIFDVLSIEGRDAARSDDDDSDNQKNGDAEDDNARKIKVGANAPKYSENGLTR